MPCRGARRLKYVQPWAKVGVYEPVGRAYLAHFNRQSLSGPSVCIGTGLIVPGKGEYQAVALRAKEISDAIQAHVVHLSDVDIERLRLDGEPVSG